MHPRTRAAVCLAAFVTTGCYHYVDSYTSAVERDVKTVRLRHGVREQLSASARGNRIEARLDATPLCRDAESGTVDSTRTTVTGKDDGWVMLFGWLFVPLVVWLMMPNRKYDTELIGSQPFSRWKNDRDEPCGTAAPVADRPVRFRAAFASSTWALDYKTKTDARGGVGLNAAPVEQLGAFCGAPSVTVNADGAPAANTKQRDTPEHPVLRIEGPAPVAVALPAASQRIFDSLAGAEADLARRCDEPRREQCRAGFAARQAEVLAQCADTCAAPVDGAPCLEAARECREQAAPDEAPVCTEALKTCLMSRGIVPAALAGCASRCAQAREAAACR